MNEKEEPMNDVRRFYRVAILLIAVFVASAWSSGHGRRTLEQTRPEQEAEQLPPPDGYLSVEDFLATRRHEFPALYPTPPPTPVEGTGQLEQIYDYWPVGTGAGIAVDVKALRLVRESAPHLVAYLDVPLDPEMLEYLRTLSRGDPVTVSGIGHGRGQSVVYIYPVHRVDGREP